MGGKSSPIKDIVKTIEKGVGDTQSAFDKTALGGLRNEITRKAKGESIILSPTNAKEEAAKDAAKDDTRQREQAISDQKEAASNLRRQEATSADASGGSTILLGKKGKKSKRGSSVSTGMGLSTGKTGLQA